MRKWRERYKMGRRERRKGIMMRMGRERDEMGRGE